MPACRCADVNVGGWVVVGGNGCRAGRVWAAEGSPARVVTGDVARRAGSASASGSVLFARRPMPGSAVRLGVSRGDAGCEVGGDVRTFSKSYSPCARIRALFGLRCTVVRALHRFAGMDERACVGAKHAHGFHGATAFPRSGMGTCSDRRHARAGVQRLNSRCLESVHTTEASA
jgi:hypothetical protein